MKNKNTGFFCSDCVHFKGYHNPINTVPCKSVGIESHAKPCEYFKMDMRKVNKLGSDCMQLLNNITQFATDSQLRLLAKAISVSSRLKKLGYSIGELVFLNMSSPRSDALSCYVSGRVISFSDNGSGRLLLQGDTGMVMDVPIDSVINSEDFEVIAAKLIKSSHIFPKDLSCMPFVKSTRISNIAKAIHDKEKLLNELLGEVVTIDSVPESWRNAWKEEPSKKKSKKHSKTTRIKRNRSIESLEALLESNNEELLEATSVSLTGN